MEKQQLSRFVSKYNLAGLVESVKWESKDGSLTTSFISDDKSVLGSVIMTEFEGTPATFGVYDTTKLIKMLSTLDSDVELSIQDIDGKAISLKFKDGSSTADYMLADLSVIPNVPDLKQLPNFDVKIKLDSNFISRFIRAKGALTDENNFTFVSKNGKSEVILGHSSINTNRISITVETDTSVDVSPISFSANFLKEILVANREASDATLNISTQGLAHIHFQIDKYESNYYLVEISN